MAHLPTVDSKYGAPMGRVETTPADRAQPMKFRLSRVYINSGGYDSGGAYWGLGGPLYQAEADAPAQYGHGYAADSNTVTRYLRAHSRDDAKDRIRAEFPNATFYR